MVGGVALGLGDGARARDAFLAAALRRGAREAVWFDVAAGWAERYRDPAPGPPPCFRRRELLLPGDAVLPRGDAAPP